MFEANAHSNLASAATPVGKRTEAFKIVSHVLTRHDTVHLKERR